MSRIPRWYRWLAGSIAVLLIVIAVSLVPAVRDAQLAAMRLLAAFSVNQYLIEKPAPVKARSAAARFRPTAEWISNWMWFVTK